MDCRLLLLRGLKAQDSTIVSCFFAKHVGWFKQPYPPRSQRNVRLLWSLHQYGVMQKLTVRFLDKEHQDLTKLSQKTERSLNDLVREAVRQYIVRETTS